MPHLQLYALELLLLHISNYDNGKGRMKMPGVTKHIFDHDIRDILSMWNKHLKCIQYVLPPNYSNQDIIDALKQYFPHEWYSVEMKYLYYTQKDKYLKNRFGKARYNMKEPDKLLQSVNQYKSMMSPITQKEYTNNFSEHLIVNARENLWKQRKPKIEKVNAKIERAKLKVQQVTPTYINQLIGLYERKSTSQKDRVYILAELKKYYSPEIIQFFYKINDSELNKQLRWDAFYHLQSFNYQPRARRQKYMQVHTKNDKQKEFLSHVYPNQTFSIPQTPQELEYRIENAKEQCLKRYNYFISHSSKDSVIVQKLIQAENRRGNDVFCDWINDADYLKRHLLCNATLKVIEKRLEQSDALIFVKSEYSLESIWCKYELNFYFELGRPIYTISAQDIDCGIFAIVLEKGDWFRDPKYKELALFEGTKVLTKK